MLEWVLEFWASLSPEKSFKVCGLNLAAEVRII